ncbi:MULTISPECIES: hypothetical protein [Streptomyces]|uniref:Aminoglycoside phosphotransferase domain-containing protein n=1 Tax=Streptomyces luteosporeus TaxID=173856 RepID=A0ABN3TY98_9ACTN
MPALAPPARPVAADVFAYAAGQIRSAAAALAPGTVVHLGARTASVTTYVRRVRIGDEELFAKLSFLGVSLVSLLRGTCGDWGAVRARQSAYVATPGSLLEREAEQLWLLRRESALRVPAVVHHGQGVLFTEAVGGPTLEELLIQQPALTAELLGTVMNELDEGLARPGVVRGLERIAIGERAIDAVFARKFNGLSGPVYMRLAGDVAEEIAAVVARLRRLRFAEPSDGVMHVTFGDLKPEHVFFPDGPGGRPVFLDPGLARGRAGTDEAKLLSRLLLRLLVSAPPYGTVRGIADGIAEFVATRTLGMERGARQAWLRQLVLLWLMDTTNIITTYVTAPPGLMLPDLGDATRRSAGRALHVMDRVTNLLEAGTEPGTVWRLALAEVVSEAVR